MRSRGMWKHIHRFTCAHSVSELILILVHVNMLSHPHLFVASASGRICITNEMWPPLIAKNALRAARVEIYREQLRVFWSVVL